MPSLPNETASYATASKYHIKSSNSIFHIGELNLEFSVEERPWVGKNQLCKEVIEQVWTSGKKNQLQFIYMSERSFETVVTVHICRTRVIHDDFWLGIYETYTDEQFIQKYGL